MLAVMTVDPVPAKEYRSGSGLVSDSCFGATCPFPESTRFPAADLNLSREVLEGPYRQAPFPEARS